MFEHMTKCEYLQVTSHATAWHKKALSQNELLCTLQTLTGACHNHL